MADLKKKNSHLQNYLTIILSMLGVYFVISAFTGIWPLSINNYNSYSLQAQRWLEGHLDLGRDYSHLELAFFNDKVYVSFPPFPSFVMLPFVILFGTNTPDHLITMIIGIVGAIYIYHLALLKNIPDNKSVFLALFSTIASNFLFVGANGSVWFIAQTMSFTLCVMSIYYASTAKQAHAGVSLALWACAVGCRPFQAVYIPILLYLIYKKFKNASPDIKFAGLIKQYALASIGAIVIALVYMTLNYMRFGNVTEFGHNYLPEFTEAQYGQFSSFYLAENIHRLFRLPSLTDSKALNFPIFDGVAFWLVSPVFVLYLLMFVISFFTKDKHDKTILFLTPALIIIHLLLLCMHRTMGGWQWGNRYTVDAIPFVVLALVHLFPKQELKINLKPYVALMFFIGLGLNLVGTIALHCGWI